MNYNSNTGTVAALAEYDLYAYVSYRCVVGSRACGLSHHASASYAPDLNPDEGIWNHLKYAEHKNTCCHTVRQLTDAVEAALHKIKAATEILHGCSAQAGLC